MTKLPKELEKTRVGKDRFDFESSMKFFRKLAQKNAEKHDFKVGDRVRHFNSFPNHYDPSVWGTVVGFQTHGGLNVKWDSQVGVVDDKHGEESTGDAGAETLVKVNQGEVGFEREDSK